MVGAEGYVKKYARTPTYNSWSSMCQRCTNPRRADYQHYGGRGISVFSEWLGRGGFSRFREYLGERPRGTTLDRIDHDGDYVPGNVRWETASVQTKNRGCNVIEFRGETTSTEEIARRLGMSPGALRMRLSRGWDKERAYTTPPRK